MSTTVLKTKYGVFDLAYHEISEKRYVSLAVGNVTTGRPVVRIHSACLFGESFGSHECDCAGQLQGALRAIQEKKRGVLVYSCDDEGRGLGLEGKVKAMELQRTEKCTSIAAFAKLGHSPDPREFSAEVEILNRLKVSRKIDLLTDNFKKIDAVERAGYTTQPLEEKIKQRSRLRGMT